jgi:hypothetical protein
MVGPTNATSKGVGWTLARAKRVPGLVVIRHRPGFHVPPSAAGETTEPGAVGAVWLDAEWGSAHLTYFRNHVLSIPLFNDRRTTEISRRRIEAAAAQGRLPV